MALIGYFFSIIIGVTLGLVGGGGSILAVPILVYLFGMHPAQATSYSLFIVGATSLVGAVQQFRMGHVQLKTVGLFTISSAVALLYVRKQILPLIPMELGTIHHWLITKDILFMLLFALVMMLVAISMIKVQPNIDASKLSIHPIQLLLLGLVVGIMQGLFGAGGGFLIIPALLFYAHLDMKTAVGSSLVIIFINSTIGFIGDMAMHVPIDFTRLFSITIMAIGGMIIGIILSQKIDGAKLKPAFGWMILVMGFYIITKELLH